MNIKKIGTLLFIALFISVSLVAQNVGEPDPAQLGVDTAQQRLKEVSITRFSDAGFWRGAMPLDQGIIQLRRLEGGPLDAEPIPDEEQLGIVDDRNYVLGAKVQYYRRGHNEFFVRPVRPLPIEGITKTISVWVVGRNMPHTLKLLLSDYYGNKAEVTMGRLNFTGWRKMTVSIPSGVMQRDYRYQNRQGLKIEGFKIECHPEETWGTYYIYFDDMRAVTDLFAEEARDVDDMPDNW